MADLADLVKTFFTIAAFGCIHGRKARSFENVLTADDLRYYVRGNHEVEEFEIIDPIASSKRPKRSLSESILLTSRLKLHAFDEDFYLELFENPWLVPSDLTVKHIYERHIQEEPINSRRCHFHGSSKNHNDSVAVISTCAGVHGLITFDSSEIYIEPLKRDHKSKMVPPGGNTLRQPHIVYKRRLKEESQGFCGTMEDHSHERKRIKKDIEDTEFEFYVGPKFMEIKLVLDAYFVQAHSPHASEYALALMNIASRRFVDPSLGFPIHLYIVAIDQFYTVQPFEVYSSLLLTFLSFRDWLTETRNNNDDDPNHWDHGILLSSYYFDLEFDPGIGYGSRLPPMCFQHPNRTSCNAVMDLGLETGFTIVHEIGHSLGLLHDDEGGVGCGTHYIMASKVNEEQSVFKWSSCSRKSLNKLWRGEPGCLDDIPGDEVRSVSINVISPDVPSVDEQCREYVTKLFPADDLNTEYVFACREETTCETLFCKVSIPYHFSSYYSDEEECSAWGSTPVEGTRCGPYQYCINGECVSNVEDVSSLEMSDGTFSEWESSPCSRSCGGGIKVTRRACTNPRYAFGGAFCDGQHLHYQLCNMQPCDEQKSFLEERMDSCADIDSQLGFRVLSGNQVPSSCLKTCWNYTSSTWDYYEPVYFEDGMECWDDIFNDEFNLEKRCVAGACVPFNCYGDKGNEGKYDVCRICGGNGTSCSLHSETIFNGEEEGKEILLPENVTSVLVVNHKCDTYQGRTALDVQQGASVFTLEGNIFRVGFNFSNGDRCAVNLTSSGPLSTEFSLMLEHRNEKVANQKLFTVTYYLPNPMSTYLWRPGPFSKCSVDCGHGTRMRDAKCFGILDGEEQEVAENLCDIQVKPITNLSCSIPCWSFTFSPCTNDQKGYVFTRVRSAECKIGEEVVDSSKCNQATKPVNIHIPCSDDLEWIKYEWIVGPWSICDNCLRTREIMCVMGPQEFPVSSTSCNYAEKPPWYETCPTTACSSQVTTPHHKTTYSWHEGTWSICYYCDKRYRSVECVEDNTRIVVSDAMCNSWERPDDSETCHDGPSCSFPTISYKSTYRWSTGLWSLCSNCQQTRSVQCIAEESGEVTSFKMCDPLQRPSESRECEGCSEWIPQAWSECSVSCGTGLQTRRVYCSSTKSERCSKSETKYCNNGMCEEGNSKTSPGKIIIPVTVVTIFLIGLCGVVVHHFIRKRKNQRAQMSRLRDHNTTEAPVNLYQISTVSVVPVNTLPSSRVTDGIVHQSSLADLPDCFQREDTDPDLMLQYRLNRLKQPQASSICALGFSNTSGHQDGSQLHQRETASDPENLNPCYIQIKGKVAFLVTKTPCSSAFERFWKLIWQEKVPIIVNLTKRKPVSPENDTSPVRDRYGEFHLSLLTRHERPDYELREVRVVKGSERRHVTICHFHSWPESGTPDQSEGLIGFIKKVQSIHRGHVGPLLVHYNSDCGVCGTFVAIFSLVDSLRIKQRVNVQDCVENMTKNHQQMTPNQSQCNFIQETLAVASLFPHTDLVSHNLLSMDLNDNKHLSRTMREFKALSHQQKFGTTADSEEGRKAHNASKNRYPNIVPLDPYRPIWKHTHNDDVINYINGTLVDSFWSHNGIIMTQSPLPNTIEDFWNAIYSYKCAAIVSLNSFTKRNESVPRYWLEGYVAHYGEMIIKCSGLPYTKRGVFVRQKLRVRREGNTKPLKVDHYEFLDWPKSSNNMSGLLHIIAVIQQLLKARKRIVIHCLDGVGRCGVITAVSTELGRVKEDGIVDLFQTALKLRRRNPNVLKSQEEYDLCYSIIQAALKVWRRDF